MGIARRLLLGVVVAVLLLAAVVAVRTVTWQPPGHGRAPVALATAVEVDIERAANRLSEAIRIRTVSHQDAAENEPAEWDRLHAWLEQTYPAAHAAMTREVLAGHALLYTWAGRDAAKPAIVLLAHQDVVPVTPGTEGDWTNPPFDGVVADGKVWGRGAIDDKGSLVALFEAVESLAASGFVPERTVLLALGHDEEVGGKGASAIASLLRERGTPIEFALDEGMAVVTGAPLAKGPVALIGIAEKGYATLKVTAPAAGGHSSAPPPQTGAERIAKAVVAIGEREFPYEFDGPAADMIRGLAADADWPVRMAVANEWLFQPLLVRQIAATPTGAALLHTTSAPTMLRGSPKENVLPQDAAAWINYRIAPQNSTTEVLARAKNATEGLELQYEWQGAAYEPSRVSSTESPAYALLAALAADTVRDVPVVPALVTVTTDSRWFDGLATDVYRFQPIVASVDDLKMIHGTDEHLTLDNLRRLVGFYTRLIATAAGPKQEAP